MSQKQKFEREGESSSAKSAWDSGWDTCTVTPSSCELCSRDAVELTCHHLVPRSRQKKSVSLKKFSRLEMRGRTATLCIDCHTHIHTIFSDKELAADYHCIELLQASEQVLKFIKWIRKQR